MIHSPDRPDGSFWQSEDGTIIEVYGEGGTKRYRRLGSDRSAPLRTQILKQYRTRYTPDWGYYKLVYPQAWTWSHTYRGFVSKWGFHYQLNSRMPCLWVDVNDAKAVRVSRCHWISEGNEL